MAVRKRTVPTKPKKGGIEKGPSRAKATPTPKKSPFKGAKELIKQDEKRGGIFGRGRK